MAITTTFTQLVGCEHPLQNAGMGTASPELGMAVARAGGLGMLSGTLVPLDALEAQLTAVAAASPGRLGINFLVPFLDDPAVVDVAARFLPVVEFFYGDPDAGLVARVHRGGALAAWQVGSLDEARAAVDAGCDFVIAQGVEAGGHVRGVTPLMTLLGEILPRVPVPVLAAGGIGDGRGIADVLRAGAAGARLGTRFVASPESGYHPRYQQALVAAGAGDTEHTTTFSVMWPDAPHRVLRSSMAAVASCEDPVVGTMVLGGQVVEVPRCSVMAPLDSATGNIDAMALYAGESVAAIHDIRPAGELVQRLMAEAEAALDTRGVG